MHQTFNNLSTNEEQMEKEAKLFSKFRITTNLTTLVSRYTLFFSCIMHRTINNFSTIEEEQMEKEDKLFSKFRIKKNLTVVSFGTLLILGADDIILTYQSTLNRDNGVGVASIAVASAFGCLASFFLPKYLVLKFGSKRIMILSIILLTPYFLANYYPVYYLMLLTSMINGVGFSLLFESIDPYINDLSSMYADRVLEKLTLNICEKRQFSMEQCNCLHTVSTSVSNTNKCHHSSSVSGLNESIDCQTMNQSHTVKHLRKKTRASQIPPGYTNQNQTVLETTTVNFFSFHSMIYQTCYIFSNLSSFFMLQSGYSSDPQPTSYNDTCLCGVDYCNVESDCSKRNLQQPSTEARTILVSASVGASFLAAVLLVIFLDDLKTKETNITFTANMVWATLQQMKKRNNWFLAFLVVNIGLMKGFYLDDFTKSYIGCAWGLRYVGLVTACASTCMALFSVVSGWLTKYLGSLPVFLTTYILNTVWNVILLTWYPDPSNPSMFFLTAGLYGVVFGTYFSQVRALFGMLFKENEEAAFGAYFLYYCVGMCLFLSSSEYLCNNVKLYLMIAASTFGIIGYLVVERGQSTRDTLPVIPNQNSEANIVEVTRF